MRFDALGLFWEDKQETVNRPIPSTPDTGWCLPSEFPRLDGAPYIAIDIETYDPELKSKGPGVRRDGYIVGLAVGVPDGRRWYFPMRHSLGGNMNPEAVLRWARKELCRPRQPKYGANLLYDLDYLWHAGVPVCGDIIDVLLAEPMLDEYRRSYSLDSVARNHLGEGKQDNALYEWAALAYGGVADRSQAANIWRCPVELVGPYAEGDVDLPLRIWEVQKPLLEKEGLLELYKMEGALTYPLLKMRQRGVPVDSTRADEVNDIMLAKEVEAQERLNNVAGLQVDVWASATIASAYSKLGIPIICTEKGNPSFTKVWLEQEGSLLSQGIVNVRKWSKNRRTFIEGYIQNYTIDGRIHALFHQLKSDEGGTVTGRFSSSQPNLQNIPARDKELAQLIRSLFIPEQGCQWRRYDWSQIEYRFLAHYARGDGSVEIVRRYIEDPNTDYHEATKEIIQSVTGILLNRKTTKGINFGLTYGMMLKALSVTLSVTMEVAQEMLDVYHRAVPFVKSTFDYADNRAQQGGQVRTILGRVARFPFWESTNWKIAKRFQPLRNKADSVCAWGRVRRSQTFAALNRVMQGSAADLMKRALLDAHEAGVFDIIGHPHNIVHDEFNFSDEQTKLTEEAFRELRLIMENCIKIKVPIIADCEVGPNWGNLK